MLRVVTSVAISSVCGAAVPVMTKMIQVEGAACDGSSSFHARVFYPTDSTQRYPILSFAHGDVATKAEADPANYNGTMLGVAGAGYIIIGLSDCPSDKKNEWREQIDSIVYMRSKEPTLRNIIDYNASTGIFGHSMGAHSTLISASDTDAVQRANIAAAVSMHPGTRFHDTLLPKVSTLYWTGEKDTLLSTPSSVKKKYDQCPKSVDRGYAVFSGENHFSPVGSGPNNEIEWVVAMMDCKIKTDVTACDKLFGSGSGSMCASQNISVCETHRAEYIV